MKMFKKLMAVVLTGVMAVSMLTGCAFGDAAIGTAVEKALNAKETYQRSDSAAKQTLDFNYSSSMKSTAKKVWDDQLKNGTITTKTFAEFTNGTTKYLYYVVDRPSDDYKAAKGWKGANGEAQALYNAVVAKGVEHSVTGSDVKIYTPTTKTGSDVKKKVNFGVYSAKKTESGNTNNYVVIVFKVAPVASTNA